MAEICRGERSLVTGGLIVTCVLESEQEWIRYKDALVWSLTGSSSVKVKPHYGEPTEFPCVVVSYPGRMRLYLRFGKGKDHLAAEGESQDLYYEHFFLSPGDLTAIAYEISSLESGKLAREAVDQHSDSHNRRV